MCHLGALSFIHHHFLLALTHVSPSSINFQMTITAPFISSSSCIHNSQLKPHTPQYHHIIHPPPTSFHTSALPCPPSLRPYSHRLLPYCPPTPARPPLQHAPSPRSHIQHLQSPAIMLSSKSSTPRSHLQPSRFRNASLPSPHIGRKSHTPSSRFWELL